MSRRRLGVMLAAVVTVLAGCAAVATSADAGFGELGRVGSFGTGSGQFDYPTALAVDSEDNSAYVLDEPAAERPGIGPASFRIQKFLPAPGLGAPVASASIATPEVGGRKQLVDEIAVDSALHRLYVLKTVETTEPGPLKYVASEIDAYSTATEPSATLILDPRVPGGVFYSFPALVKPVPTGTLIEPDGLAVDPTTHNLIVLGYDETGATVIERIDASAAPSYASGSLDPERFDDTGEKIAPEESAANGLAVDGGGTIYVVAQALKGGTPGLLPGVAKLSGGLSAPTVTVVHKVEGEPGEPFPLTGGRAGTGGVDFGAQIAVAPDTPLVYATEVSKAEELGGLGAGNYEVRGMSTEAGAQLGSQQVVFGGGTTQCNVASKTNAIAAGKGGVVYALDEGDVETVGGTPKPSPFGFRLVEFGPNGAGCPSPSAAFKINESDSPTVVVAKGQTVTFNAAESALDGEEPVELDWDLDGSGKYATKVTGSPASLQTTTRYVKPGTYTIGLKIALKNGGSFGEPSPATKTVKVNPTPPTASFEASSLSPKPGEAVMFNGGGSIDPTGTCSQEGGCVPTHNLKEYIWNFGDGTETATTTLEVSHAFASAAQYSVSLTVVNQEGVASTTPASQTISVQSVGSPPTQQGGGGGGGGTPITAQVGSQGPVTPVVASLGAKTPVKPLTKAQKLAKALKACKRVKPKKRRLSCERAARAKYGPKPKKKH